MYHIAIPSYNRAEILIIKTLDTLKNISNHVITIFVANEEEYNIYSLYFSKDFIHCIYIIK
jgi:hypothetical protein